ncbi:MAG: M20/M25/M40 family metallo-hydrolase [Gemmatimonadales bacterium]|nr:M20/M25/M40 family metallo-hydrolase [Gemmatimonadales bacterium]
MRARSLRHEVFVPLRRPPLAAALLSLCLAHVATAQTIPGFTPVQAARLRKLEGTLLGVPDTARLQRHVRTLAAEPHVAGTPAQTRTADYVLREMAAMGLDTSRTLFRVWLPYPDSTRVERVRPTPLRLALDEPALPDDPTTQSPPWRAMNGYSGAGDVTAPLVYVNYGLADDYAELERLGVSVRGKVAIARYGRSFRGTKSRLAEANGAVGLLIYSDPQDDGYFRGDTYPAGPMRHPDALQRGSIFNGAGDPSTPGWPSTADARRLPLAEMAVPTIPVVPIAYRNAQALIEGLRGPSVPQPWQGALPFRYHVGGDDAVTVRVAVWPEQGERGYKTVMNTFGVLRGADWPDEQVITGGHRDGWGPGATDNVSGIATILESARAWAAAAKQGLRPRRTLVFATWDAEEWGMVGSSEQVELDEERLLAQAVAYLNQDVTASGRSFGASATASLHALVRDVAASVRQPGDTASVLAAWRRRTGEAEPRLGDLGGGSDYVGFYNHLGIPSFGFGFGGAGGVYHSAYDTYTFVERFADPGYLSHRAAAQVNALLLARLAQADVTPFDYDGFGRHLGTLLDRLRREARERGVPVALAELERAARELGEAGRRLAATRDSALARRVQQVQLTQANRALRGVERALTRPEGLAGRPWIRNVVMAVDREDSYADAAFPGVLEALRDRDAARAAREVDDLVARVRAAAAAVDAARTALGG